MCQVKRVTGISGVLFPNNPPIPAFQVGSFLMHKTHLKRQKISEKKTGGLFHPYHGPPKPTFLEVFMVNNLVFRWPKPLVFTVLVAYGISGVLWDPYF